MCCPDFINILFRSQRGGSILKRLEIELHQTWVMELEEFIFEFIIAYFDF